MKDMELNFANVSHEIPPMPHTNAQGLKKRRMAPFSRAHVLLDFTQNPHLYSTFNAGCGI